MLPAEGTPDRKVVIDACAAIKLQRLDRFGSELFTTGGVIREIKDENARAMLATLPQELIVREPLTQDILFVKNFAKATGDLGFLSHNDIELIALTVQLNREEGGSVKDRPAQLAMGQDISARFDWAPSNPSKEGAALVQDDTPEDTANGKQEAADEEDEGWTTVVKGPAPAAPWAAARKEPVPAPAATASAPAAVVTDSAPAASASSSATVDAAVDFFSGGGGAKSVTEVLAVVEAVEAAAEEEPADATESPVVNEEVEEVEGEASDSEDGSSAGEWVTQDNMHRFGLGVQAADDLRVTCATADYSCQNVLLQMGITPLTFDGYAVRSVKLWGLICRACFHFTRDTTKVFCPKCGNDTVVRVPIIVDEKGQAQVCNSGRKLRTKGTVYSIPNPKGGRGWKPIYAEDEVLLGGRDRQLRHAENLQNKERQARDPFNGDNATRGWYQRRNMSGCKGPGDIPVSMKAGLGRVNPNANNYKFKKGKK